MRGAVVVGTPRSIPDESARTNIRFYPSCAILDTCGVCSACAAYDILKLFRAHPRTEQPGPLDNQAHLSVIVIAIP
jgi:hypothetical protein